MCQSAFIQLPWARVIYYCFDERNPIYLLFAYTKNDRDNLSAAQRNAIKKMISAIKAQLREGRAR